MVGGEDNAYELALGSQHGRIWDRQPKVTREGVTVRILNTHRRDTDPLPVAFQAVAFSGDGLTCAAADKRGHLYIFYLQLNRFSLLSREPVGPALGALCFTQRRHEEVLVASKTLVRAFDVDTHRNSADLKGHHREVTRVCSSGLAGLVLTQSSDVSILWDVKDWSKRRSLKAQSTPMCGACFTPLGDLCSILFKDSRIVLWRTSTLAFERELVLPASADGREVMLRHVATSNRHVVSAGTGGLLLVWSLARNDPPKAVEVTRPVTHLQLSTLNREAVTTRTSDRATTVIVLQDDGVLLMALLKTLRVVMTIDLRFRALVSFEISSNAKYLLAAISDGCLELREVAKGIDYERKSIEQRIQLGAPEKLLQKVLKSRPDAWKAPGDASSRSRERSRERPECDRATAADVGEGLVLVGNARPSSSRRNSRRSPVQPQQRGANSHSKAIKDEKNGRLGECNLKFTIARDAREGATPVSSRRSRPPAWNAWDPPLVERALGPSSRSSSSSSSPDTVRELPAQTKSHGHSSPEHGRPASLASESRSPTKIYATDGGMAEVVLAPQISRKFRELLRERNVYPQKERPEIWRQILQLPYNRGAYESLEAAGVHPKFSDLQEIHPGHTKSTLSGLTRLLSALAHWSNAWADVPYLPAMAFPFLKIFGKDPVLTFEIVVCVLLNWARSWLDELPGPPLRVLARLDDLLVSVDPMLHAHLRLVCERPGIARSGAVHLAVLWPLLQTLLTEVLPKLQWLQLWDHLLTHWLEPELLLAAIVAFLKSCRASLLLLPAHAPRAIDEWLRRPEKQCVGEFTEWKADVAIPRIARGCSKSKNHTAFWCADSYSHRSCYHFVQHLTDIKARQQAILETPPKDVRSPQAVVDEAQADAKEKGEVCTMTLQEALPVSLMEHMAFLFCSFRQFSDPDARAWSSLDEDEKAACVPRSRSEAKLLVDQLMALKVNPSSTLMTCGLGPIESWTSNYPYEEDMKPRTKEEIGQIAQLGSPERLRWAVQKMRESKCSKEEILDGASDKKQNKKKRKFKDVTFTPETFTKDKDGDSQIKAYMHEICYLFEERWGRPLVVNGIVDLPMDSKLSWVDVERHVAAFCRFKLRSTKNPEYANECHKLLLKLAPRSEQSNFNSLTNFMEDMAEWKPKSLPVAKKRKVEFIEEDEESN